MKRVEEFRKARKNKRITMLALLCILALMLCGVYTADASVNYLMKGVYQTDIAHIAVAKGEVLEIALLGRHYRVDTGGFQRGVQRAKERVMRIFTGE